MLLCSAGPWEYLRTVRLRYSGCPRLLTFSLGLNMSREAEMSRDQCICSSLQVFQEELGVVKSYNLKPGGDKIPVTNQNRKGEWISTKLSTNFTLYCQQFSDGLCWIIYLYIPVQSTSSCTSISCWISSSTDSLPLSTMAFTACVLLMPWWWVELYFGACVLL